MANQHIVPNNGQWQVKRENATRATKTFDTQKEAIAYGRNIAIHQESELVIHDRHGRIRDKDTNRFLNSSFYHTLRISAIWFRIIKY